MKVRKLYPIRDKKEKPICDHNEYGYFSGLNWRGNRMVFCRFCVAVGEVFKDGRIEWSGE